jgi:hypothetical protein
LISVRITSHAGVNQSLLDQEERKKRPYIAGAQMYTDQVAPVTRRMIAGTAFHIVLRRHKGKDTAV